MDELRQLEDLRNFLDGYDQMVSTLARFHATAVEVAKRNGIDVPEK
ncbi:hypothetical protein [Kocuria rosea]|nr:hypothetical protein [Kocuria rosea]